MYVGIQKEEDHLTAIVGKRKHAFVQTTNLVMENNISKMSAIKKQVRGDHANVEEVG